MPFDPARPHDHATIEADELRAQFNGLKDITDALAAGGITGAVVDSVTTLNPGESATATFTLIGTVLHLSLAIPRGADGIPGLQGVQGVAGLQGPAFANAVIDSVTTLNPGEAAYVWVSFDGTNVHLSFGIPRGAQGEQGIQGPPGEVTNAAMSSAISSAIAGTSNNTNGIALLNLTVSDPPAQAELQAVANKLDELITALRR